MKKRKLKERRSFHHSDEACKVFSEDEDHLGFVEGKKDEKPAKKNPVKLKKRKLKERRSFHDLDEACNVFSGDEDRVEFVKEHEPMKAERVKKTCEMTAKKKRRREKGRKVYVDNFDQLSNDGNKELNGWNSNEKEGNDCAEKSNKSKQQSEIDSSAGLENGNVTKKIKHKKSKKDKKSKRKDAPVLVEERAEETSGTGAEKVDEIVGVDEDCSRGMRKWLIEYKESRPGLKILQQKIDEFIAAHEAQEEQAREEREAHAAEGGWTVVAHHKGRKKTTDSESGTAVGSVAEAAVMDKMAKKKSKELQGFYRFQLKEARRNEVMVLQSKFEQDKKRIQQLRAARKFRPY